MFADSELVFTRDRRNVYMGGGYLLKSELMEGGAPPIFNVATNNSDNDNDNVNGDTTTGESRSPHNGRRGNRRKKNTVSSLLFSSGTIAVPAGLFLMNAPNNNEAEAVIHSIYDDSRIKRLIASNRSDSSSSSSNSSSNSNSNSNSSDDDADYNSRHRRHGHNASVVSETLYDTLFNMLSPTADKRLYWTNGAKTQRRGHQHNNNNNNTRKIKKNKITE